MNLNWLVTKNSKICPKFYNLTFTITFTLDDSLTSKESLRTLLTDGVSTIPAILLVAETKSRQCGTDQEDD